ncbi:MAG TPA: carboxypeptidase regulatory-like domain-containing protein [Vicinamibacterales bacterium]
MLRFAVRTLLAVVLVTMSVPAFAQPAQTGTISGEIKDSTGAVLPGVTVTITSQDRGFARETISDENGRYVFPAVPIGMYRITATLQGFQTASASDNLVEVEKTTSVPLTLSIGQLTDTVQVVGETPIVDPTTVTATTRLSKEEFEKLPVGRSYQALTGAAPGVVGTGNVNSAGALTTSNLYIIDAVDTTDPTTGTFGTNLNFEAIQEVSVLTSAVGAEYGRAQGAIVNVITKSGTNRFEGAFKYLFANDDWNAQNTTVNEITGASLERVKFDKVNPTYSFSGGGPIWRNRAFFFATYELIQNTSPQRQTAGAVPEDFQQVREDKYSNVRGTFQVRDGHTVWLKYYQSPGEGIVRDDYWGTTFTGDREALTAQSQTAENWAAQWSGVIRNNWSLEAAGAAYESRIDVGTFEQGILSGAPIESLADGKVYNGATFDGFVERPRQQFNIASNWFLTPGGRSHNIKAGYDFQNLESGAQFDYPNRQYYIAESYDPVSRTPVFGPNSVRQDYDSGASVSTGKIHSLFIRDKMEVSDRLSAELGLRWENQSGASDIGQSTVDTSMLAPRLSATYDLDGQGNSLITASYGRYYSSIIQSFSDAFAQVAQQTNYNNYAWNGSAFVFQNRVQLSGGSSFQPNLDLKASHMDEFTVGYQRQIGRYFGASARFIARGWGNLIDDTRTFNPDGSINRQVVNYDEAERNYRGVQFSAEKRFADNWNAQASYTYSRTRGNHFPADVFTALGDYTDAQCRTTVDLTIGTNGVLPCAEVQNGANKIGLATYDRPHNFKMAAAYVRPVGPVNLTFGALTEMLSKFRYEKQRTMNVLIPGTTLNSGNTATYFYNERGEDPVEGMEWYLDTSVEATWRLFSTAQAGFRAEIFNLTNRQEQLRSNNVVWCGSDAGTGCSGFRTNYGKATSRGSYRGGLAGTFPRSYRFSAIFRF